MTQDDMQFWSTALLKHWHRNPPQYLTPKAQAMIAIELQRRAKLEAEISTDEFAAIDPRDEEGADQP